MTWDVLRAEYFDTVQAQHPRKKPCSICRIDTEAISGICWRHPLDALEKTDTPSLPGAATGFLAPLQANVSVSSSALEPVDGALGRSVVPVAPPVDVGAGAGGSVLA